MRRLAFFSALIFMLSAQISRAQIPETVSYQGILTDASSEPVGDGDYSLTFSVYSVETGGAVLWSETHDPVEVVDGVFSVVLGSINPLNLPFDDQYWLGVQVNGGAELVPRTPFTSSAYSLNARSVADGAVTTGKIDDDAVTGGKIADGQVVRSLNSKTDDVTLLEGANITITPGVNTFTISATDSTGNDWKLTGNAGTTAGPNFLGTTDNEPLELRVFDARVLLLEPHATSPNFIGGHGDNAITPGVYGATICGGGQDTEGNRVTDHFGTIGGGRNNLAGDDAGATLDAWHATVSGGRDNRATHRYATIGGGYQNQVNGQYSTVGGGEDNFVPDSYCAVGGGKENVAGNDDSILENLYITIGGGYQNSAVGLRATIGGGYKNKSDNNSCVVAGGLENQATGPYSAIGGGRKNEATGSYSVIPGGYLNEASGSYSFAAGRRAKAAFNGSFVWADSTDDDFSSYGPNRFMVRASGGIYLYTKSDTSTGVWLNVGDSSWNIISDRAMKRNIRPVDGKEILSRLSEIPISRWSYKAQDPEIEHIGPMAQDFYAAFGLGTDERCINTIDPDGVALAAIQGLYELVKEKEAENAALHQRVRNLEDRLEALEAAK